MSSSEKQCMNHPRALAWG